MVRNFLDNSFVKALYQKDSERIVVFELEKEGNYFLIFELFSKGNAVLTRQDYEIITCLERQVWKDRVIKPGEKLKVDFFKQRKQDSY